VINIDIDSSVPLYEQIKLAIHGLVTRGYLRPGDQVPAIRHLAQSLVVNPNTIARAYRELILEGFLEARRGEGNFVSLNAVESATSYLDRAQLRLAQAILAARNSGLTWKQITKTVAISRQKEIFGRRTM
jgi:GntR family transcriptional regulator